MEETPPCRAHWEGRLRALTGRPYLTGHAGDLPGAYLVIAAIGRSMQESSKNNGGQKEGFVVHLDAIIEDLIPDFLEHRKGDVTSIRNALERDDFEALSELGHNIEGTSGAFGFRGMARIGRSLRAAVREHDGPEVQRLADELANYLDRVEVVYD